MEQGDFGGQYETGMSSRGAAAPRDFGRPMSAQSQQETHAPQQTVPHSPGAPRRGWQVHDLMLPISFKPLLKYLRRCSLVNFGKLLERKRGGYTHNIGINGL